MTAQSHSTKEMNKEIKLALVAYTQSVDWLIAALSAQILFGGPKTEMQAVFKASTELRDAINKDNEIPAPAPAK